MARWIVLAVALLASACAPSSSRGPVSPAPAGPMDVVRSIWGDYSGRCPSDYVYCSTAGQAICCPIGQRCAEDEGGAYCAPRDGGPGLEHEARSPASCFPDEITCSYMGRTICCPGSDRCCASDGGPACCDAR